MKNLQSLLNPYETWSKLLGHLEVTLLESYRHVVATLFHYKWPIYQVKLAITHVIGMIRETWLSLGR